MKKIVSIVGARPNFIKLSALSPFIEKKFNHIIVHTGQHYDFELSEGLFSELGLRIPKYNLGIGSASRSMQISKILQKGEKVLQKEKPDLVVVYGDTNSTLAGALAASLLGIPVAHVESGERCGNPSVPEELNRTVVDHISSILFAPTQNALTNLRKENLKKAAHFTGDLMIDALASAKLDSARFLRSLSLKKGQYIYATIHRFENTNGKEQINNILKALNNLEYTVVFPLHPRTAKVLKRYKIHLSVFNNINFIKPQQYKNSLALISCAHMVISDSGGVLKESYYYKTPCIVLRGEIEEKTLTATGWVTLLNPKSDLPRLADVIKNLKVPKNHPDVYGRGHASNAIINRIQAYLK